jgi:hypothetical protein
MFSVNGIGTTLYGRREVNPVDSSYIATKWLIFFFLPLVPLGSYRIIKAKQKFFSAQWPQYQMTSIPLHRPQVFTTYTAVWGTIIVLIIIAVLVG